MKKNKNVFMDKLLLVVSAILIISAPMVFYFLTDLPIDIKENILFYYLLVVLFIVFFFVFKPFANHYRWFGFNKKKPIIIGALINSFIIVLIIIFFRKETIEIPTIYKIPLTLFEMLAWVYIMRAIGYLKNVYYKKY